MLTKYLFFSCFFLLHGLNAFAQPTIALEHDGTSTFFTDIPSAVNAAVSGDTIYLPGGIFPGFSIDKKLTIVGAGHDPGSTVATTRTVISGNVNMYGTNFEGSVITGLRINGGIINYGFFNNVQITRCFVSNVIDGNGNIGTGNWTISECIIGSISNLPLNSLVSNNLIKGQISGQSSRIENNIFLFNNETTPPIGNFACSIKNNIFKSFNDDLYVTANYTFNNNIWSDGDIINGLFGYGNIGVGNIQEADFDALFSNFSFSNFALNGYSLDILYQSDLHLINPAYNTGGTDGAPIGIYGGLFPWKAGSVPFNPHIESKQISSTTDPSGNLNVNIQVEAQDN